MRIEDIPKLTRVGQYNVRVNFGYLERQLSVFTEDYELELNPDFQRGHVWNEAQQIAYVEYLLRGGKHSRTILFNCPAFGNAPRDSEGYYKIVLVDGLQRLTAVREFVAGRLRAFGYLLAEFEDAEQFLRSSSYGFDFNVNDLATREDVLKWYLDLNSGGTPHAAEEIERVRGLLSAERARRAVSASAVDDSSRV